MQYRIYNHMLVEEKIAKLFLYTMGQYKVDSMKKINPDLSIYIVHRFKKCTEFESITLTLKQIEHISGLNARSVKELDFFNNNYVKNIWNISFEKNKTVTIAAKKQDNMQEIIERCYFILKNKF